MTTIRDIKPIHESPVLVCSREQLSKIVELPCLEACYVLYDKNIQTNMSSANNADSIAYIDIIYDSLDDANKRVVRQLIDDGKVKYCEYSGVGIVKIFVPINNDSKVEDVSNSLLEIAECFLEQDLLYGSYNSLMTFEKAMSHNSFNSIEEILNYYGMTSVDEYVAGLGGFAYDEDTGQVWCSKELLEKHKKFVTQSTIK